MSDNHANQPTKRTIEYRSGIRGGWPRGMFAGWLMLLVSAIAVFMSGPGQTFGVSAFVDPMLTELGWSRSRFSLTYAIGTLASAGALVVAGRQIDRFGNRLVLSVAAVGFGIALLVLSVSSNLITVVLGFTLLRTCGSGVLTLAARTLVPRWFHRRAGRAFSLIGFAAMSSQAAVPPFNERLIHAYGWQHAWRVDAAIMLLVLFPIVAFVTRNRPEDVGQTPDGLPPVNGSTGDALRVLDHGPTLREAMRTGRFWALIGGGAVPALVVTGLSFNQVTIITERGMPSSLAATTFAVDAGVALPTTLLAGWLVDRYPLRFVLAAGQIALLAGMIVLVETHSPAMAMIYAGCRGLSNGLWSVAADVAWPSYFGRAHLGSIRGFGYAFGFAGAAIGPIPFGIAYDVLGGYNPAILGLMVLPAIAAVAVARSKPPSIVALG